MTSTKMRISPIVELRIIRALGDYLEDLESSKPFSIECVEKIVRRVFVSQCPGLKENVHCYIVNRQKTLAEKIRAGDFTILVDLCDDRGAKSAAAKQKEHHNLDPKAGRREKLLALARQQSNQRVNINDSTVKAKTITPANAERNNENGEKGETIDLTELGKDGTQFSDVPPTNIRLSDSSSLQSRCDRNSSSDDDEEPFLGFSKHMIDNVRLKLEAFYTDYMILDDVYQPQSPALTPSSNRVRGRSDKLDHNDINDNRLLLDASEIPKKKAFHTEYMIPDELPETLPLALLPSSSGLTPSRHHITPFSIDSIRDDKALMTAFEIPKAEVRHTEYMIPDTAFHPHHTIVNYATSQARKAQLYSELNDLMQRNHVAEVEIARWEAVRLELRGQLRKKEQELKGLLQQETREDP